MNIAVSMLKENWRLISRLERAGDLILIALCFIAAYYGRSSLVFWNQFFDLNLPLIGPELAPLKDYVLIVLLSMLFYAVVLSALGAYESMRLVSSLRLFALGTLSSAVVFLLLAASLFLLKIDVSRSLIALFCLLVSLSLTAERYLVLAILRFFRRRGRNFRNIIICGVGPQALRVAKEVHHRPELGIRIRGFGAVSGIEESDSVRFRNELQGISSAPIIKGKEKIENALKEYAIDEVIFTDVFSVMTETEELLVACSEQGVETSVVADLFSVGLVKSKLSYFGGIPLIHFETPPGDRWDLSLKRILDIILSGVSLIVLSPIFLLTALLVALSMGRPILFRQKRVGLNGRSFSLYKFRTMVVDAEKELEKLRDKNEMSGPVFKMKDDPRVTPLGRFLRRFSLDELPQFWNVLRGDMSLVGPRPPVPGEVSMYERRDRRRLSMRPGLTCTWQVNGRNKINDFDEWVKMDLEYIDNWSFGRDLWLLLRTIPAVLFVRGAR